MEAEIQIVLPEPENVTLKRRTCRKRLTFLRRAAAARPRAFCQKPEPNRQRAHTTDSVQHKVCVCVPTGPVLWLRSGEAMLDRKRHLVSEQGQRSGQRVPSVLQRRHGRNWTHMSLWLSHLDEQCSQCLRGGDHGYETYTNTRTCRACDKHKHTDRQHNKHTTDVHQPWKHSLNRKLCFCKYKQQQTDKH